MSEALDITADREAPSRGRQPRAQVQGEHRRRRTEGSLNRMMQFKLDIFAPEDLDLANYVYYWMNDEGSNLRRMTKLDDYDFVRADELGDAFNPEMTDSESTERVRMLVGNKQDGSALYAYLLKKPRAYWEADYQETLDRRQAMMEGRVYGGDITEQDEDRPGGSDKYYTPSGNVLGQTGERRRGRIPSLK